MSHIIDPSPLEARSAVIRALWLLVGMVGFPNRQHRRWGRDALKRTDHFQDSALVHRLAHKSSPQPKAQKLHTLFFGSPDFGSSNHRLSPINSDFVDNPQSPSRWVRNNKVSFQPLCASGREPEIWNSLRTMALFVPGEGSVDCSRWCGIPLREEFAPRAALMRPTFQLN